jgi:hypothetical protein
MAAQTLIDLLNLAKSHPVNRLGRYEGMVASVISGVKKVLSSNTVASNKISVTIPANTLVAGDVLKIQAGATTDGGSTAVTTNLQIDATTTIQGTGSDTNTGAHQWTWTAALYYDGANLVTAQSSLGGPTPAYVTGASNAAAASSAHTIDLVAGSSHATPKALCVEIFRQM